MKQHTKTIAQVLIAATATLLILLTMHGCSGVSHTPTAPSIPSVPTVPIAAWNGTWQVHIDSAWSTGQITATQNTFTMLHYQYPAPNYSRGWVHATWDTTVRLSSNPENPKIETITDHIDLHLITPDSITGTYTEKYYSNSPCDTTYTMRVWCIRQP